MTQDMYTADKLLDAWLSLTSTLWNTRLVTTLTYNEAHVLGILLRHEQEPPLTATYLIGRTHLLKSQMNKVLTDLEGQGFITRTRAETDRRRIEIRLTSSGKEAYAREHARIEVILGRLIAQIGAERALQAAEQLQSITDALQTILPDIPGNHV